MARTPSKEQPAEYRRGRPGGVGGDATLVAATAFAKAGFGDASLVLRWSEIAGPEVARLCQPLRLSGDTLTLKALPGAALFLAHEKRALAERINTYLGRPAVSQIKFIQGPLAARPAPPPAQPTPQAVPGTDPARRFGGPEGLGQALLSLARRRGQD